MGYRASDCEDEYAALKIRDLTLSFGLTPRGNNKVSHREHGRSLRSLVRDKIIFYPLLEIASYDGQIHLTNQQRGLEPQLRSRVNEHEINRKKIKIKMKTMYANRNRHMKIAVEQFSDVK